MWKRIDRSDCRVSRAALAATLAALSGSALARPVDWVGHTGGLWSDTGRWSTLMLPGAGDDVRLLDIIHPNDLANFMDDYEIDIFNVVHIFDNLFREVRLDVPGTNIRSLLIQEFAYPPPPTPTGSITGAPHRNVLTLEHDLSIDTEARLSGSRAILNLNGRTITADTIVIEAPYFTEDAITMERTYWFRNRIGNNVSLNDWLNGDLPGSPGNAFPVLPGPLTTHTPIMFTSNTGGVEVPGKGATFGTINASLDSQGMVWLAFDSRVTGSVFNHSAFGFFRYDGFPETRITFDGSVHNADQHAIMDINGRGFYASSVLNEQLGTMYMRSRSDLRTTWTNRSGGQFLFQSSNPGGNPADPDMLTGNLWRLNREALNEGFAFAIDQHPPTGGPAPFISAPVHPGLIGGAPFPAIFPFPSTADFDGDVVHRDTGTHTEVLEFLNRDGAVMTMRGDVNLGLVNRTPVGFPPNIIDYALDRITTLANRTGGFYTYEPRMPGSQRMDITGEIINTGTFMLPVVPINMDDPTSVQIPSVMNLFGNTDVRGRFSPMRPASGVLLTNTNGAILNYSGNIRIGWDELADGNDIDVPHGNLDNTGGTINGLASGRLVFHGGNQVNNGTINLSDLSEFWIGRQGSSMFTNNGVLASRVYAGPTPDGYAATMPGSPTFRAGFFDNTPGAVIRTDAGTTLNIAAAALNNRGLIDLNGGTLNPVNGAVNLGTTTFRGGTLAGPFFLNQPGALVNGFGGTVNAPTFVNATGGTMTLGDGTANALRVNSSTFTQSGVVNLAANFQLVANATNLVNSGTVNMSGLNATLAAPGRQVINNAVINGSGLLGFFNPMFQSSITSQVINTGTINVSALGMGLGGALMPINTGTINVASGGRVDVEAGLVGSIFTNAGNINLFGAGLTDGGMVRGLSNTGRISGVGAIDFRSGITNTTLGQIIAVDPTATFTPLVLNGAAGNFAPVGNLGTILVQNGTSLVIPNTSFTNSALLQLNSSGIGALVTDAVNGLAFTNAAGAETVVAGMNNRIEFSAAGTSITNSGNIRVGVFPGSASSLAMNPIGASGILNTAGGKLLLTNSSVAMGTVGVLRAPFTNSAGFVDMNLSSLFTGVTVNSVGVVTVGGTSLLDTLAYSNLGGHEIIGGGSTALHRGLWTNAAAFGTAAHTSVVGGSGLSATASLNVGSSIAVDNGSLFLIGLLPAGGPGLQRGVAAGDFTNINGSVSVGGGSTLAATGNIFNSGLMRFDTASILTAVNVTNTGTGNFDILGGSTATISVLDNLGVVRVFGGGSLLSTAIGTPTLNGGQIILDDGGRWINGNAGGIGLEDITNANLGFPGTISVENGSLLDALRLFNPLQGSTLHVTNGSTARLASIPANFGTIRIDSGSTLRAFDTTNNGTGNFDILGGSVATIDDLDNLGVVRVFGTGSRLSTLATDGDTANGGQVILDSGGTWINGGRNPTGPGLDDITNARLGFPGTISVENGSLLDALRLFNPLQGSTLHVTNGSTARLASIPANFGTIRIDSGSTLRAFDTTNNGTGNFDILGGSVATIDDLDNLGVVRVFGTGSRLSTLATDGDTANGGQVILDSGGTWINGGRNPTGPGLDDITNARLGFPGTISVENGSLLDALRLFNPLQGSTLHVTNGSTARLASIPANFGTIRIDSGSTLRAFDTTNNSTGVFDVTGGSTATIDNLFNLGLVRTQGVGTTLTASSPGTTHINGGNILVDFLSTMNFGPAGGMAWEPLTNMSAAFNGVVDVRDGGTLNAGLFTNPGSNSTLRVAGGGSVANLSDLANGGLLIADSGGVVNVTAAPMPVMNTGRITIDGGMSALNTFGSGFTTMGGQLSVTRGGVLDLTTLGGLLRGMFTATGGDSVLVDGTGSRLLIGTLGVAGSTMTVSGGAAVTTGLVVGSPATMLGSVLTVTGAGSTLFASTFLNSASNTTITFGASLTAPFGITNVGGSTFTIDGASSALSGAFTNTGSTTSVLAGSMLTTLVFSTTNGFVNVGGGSTLGALGITSTNSTMLIGGGSTLTGGSYTGMGSLLEVSGSTATLAGAFNNANAGGVTGHVVVSNGSTIRTRAVTNAGNIALSDTSTFRTDQAAAGVFADIDNTLGIFISDTGSMLLAGAFDNTGGELSLYSGSMGTLTGAFTNNSAGGNSGVVALDSMSALTTAAFTNGGVVTALNGSMVFPANFTNNDATLTLDFGSTLITPGAFTNNAGFVNVGSGSVLATGAFTMTQGAMVVGGASTLTTAAFTNDGGSVSVRTGSAAALAGAFLNRRAGGSTGIYSMEGMSTTTTRAVTNDGTVVVADGSVFRTDQAGGAPAAFNNSVGITIVRNASMLTTGDFNNTGGELSLSGASTATIGSLMNNNDGFNNALTLVDGGSRLTGTVLANSGLIGVTLGGTAGFNGAGSANNAGGVIEVSGAGSIFRSIKAFANNAGSALHVDAGGRALFTLAPGGAIPPGGRPEDPVATGVPMPFMNAGLITINGADSRFETAGGGLDNMGGSIGITAGGVMSLNDLSDIFNPVFGTLNSNMGSVTVAGAGSALSAGPISFVGSSLAVSGGASANAVGGFLALLGSPSLFMNGSSLTVSGVGSFYSARSIDFSLSSGLVANFGSLSALTTTSLSPNSSLTFGDAADSVLGLTVNNNGSLNSRNTNLSAGGLTNFGNVSMAGGTFTLTGNLDNMMGALLSVDSGATFTAMGGASMNAGVVRVTNGGMFNAPPVMPRPAGDGGLRGAPVLSGVGRLDIADNSSATLGGSYVMGADMMGQGGGINVEPFGTLDLAGDMDVQITDPASWTVNGTIRLRGSGQIEVAGKDFGNSPNNELMTVADVLDAGFTSNFNIGDHMMNAMGTLIISANAVVEFVNGRENAGQRPVGFDDFGIQPPGAVITSTGPLHPLGEALYIRRLVIEPNARVFLGNLHVYYFESDIGLGFQDVLAWQAMGIQFPDGRYPIPFVPAPGALVLLGAAGGMMACRRRAA